jgi:uncharacterized protein YndB with AHSA1/START domain
MTETASGPLGVIAPDGEHYAVRLEQVYPASRTELWAALTDPDELRGWIGELTGVVAPGSAFELRLADDPPEVVSCRVRIFEPESVLEFDWEPSGEQVSSLRFELADAPGGTKLLLRHSRLTRKVAAEYGAGWHTYLEQLAASLAGQPGRGDDWDTRYNELLESYQQKLP